jgi:hypothetical protein
MYRLSKDKIEINTFVTDESCPDQLIGDDSADQDILCPAYQVHPF